MANYSRNAIFGFVCVVAIIVLMTIFAVFKPAIIYDKLGGYLFLIIILICVTSLILAILAIIECRNDTELKGKYLSIATIVLLLLLICFIFWKVSLAGPAPTDTIPSCGIKGGRCQASCDTDQQLLDGTCKDNEVCCKITAT